MNHRLYVLGMQIIFIGFHLGLFVLFDKDYLYLMNGLVFFSLCLQTPALGLCSSSKVSAAYCEFPGSLACNDTVVFKIQHALKLGMNGSIKNFYCAESNTRRHSKLLAPKLQYNITKFIIRLHAENLTAKLHIRSRGGGESWMRISTAARDKHKKQKSYMWCYK